MGNTLASNKLHKKQVSRSLEIGNLRESIIDYLRLRHKRLFVMLRHIKYKMIDGRDWVLARFATFMVIKVIPKQHNCYVTGDWNEEVGTGCQTLGIYSTMLYAQFHKLTYLHTPLKSVDHNYQQDDKFEQKIEQYFSFSHDEKMISEVDLPVVYLDKISDIVRYLFMLKVIGRDRKVIFNKRHFHEFADACSDNYEVIRERFRAKYFLDKKAFVMHDVHPGKLNVVVHVRRGDVDQKDAYRFSSNAFVRNQMEGLKIALSNINLRPHFHIYSQGALDDFKDLADMAEIHLNGSIFDDFYNLVMADILIVARSSFSYSAALLSQGVIVCDRHIHNPPLSSWIIYQNQNDLLTEKAQLSLQKLRSRLPR